MGLKRNLSTVLPYFFCWFISALAFLVFLCGCEAKDDRLTITLWHQMTVGEREVLNDQIGEFESANSRIRVRAVYKETESLRSGFQAAALAGIGPELVYGPSDPMGTFVTMGIVQEIGHVFTPKELDDFVELSLIYLPHEKTGEKQLFQVGDRVGNHLALVYNKNLIDAPPKTTQEMIQLAIDTTKNKPGGGKQYGLVFNFVEPFYVIPFLTGYGAWVFEEGSVVPNLNTPECVAALKFVAELQNKHDVMPANCNYNAADSLFKEGSAAMIINGDWSWSEYLESDLIDAAVVPLPVVNETGLPMQAMVSTKGYSLNANVDIDSAEGSAAAEFVRFMTSGAVQKESIERLRTLPSRKSLLGNPVLTEDPTLVASAQQMQNGKKTPTAPELRAIWDSMRPAYQELLGGDITPEDAAEQMQNEAIRKIALMNSQAKPTVIGSAVKIVGLGLLVGLVFWYRNSWAQLATDLRNQRFAYVLILPAMLVIALTIVYPFLYNIALSFSNMSLRNFQDWQITGFQNYGQVFTEKAFFVVLLKTLIWTGVCVFFHVALGLLLATCLNGPVRGKSIYRIILILPWAIPAYITALTWRGMFNFDYGAINLMLTQWFGFSEGVNWLGDKTMAFAACIITNIWLGFPFMMVIALGGMQGIPRELYEAAHMDRVSRWKQFWHITLPMLKPVLIPATTLGAIWTFNNLNVVWLVSNAGEPADKTHILVSYVYKAVFNLYQYGYGAALSMIIFFMLLIFSLLFLKRTNATEGVS